MKKYTHHTIATLNKHESKKKFKQFYTLLTRNVMLISTFHDVFKAFEPFNFMMLKRKFCYLFRLNHFNVK